MIFAEVLVAVLVIALIYSITQTVSHRSEIAALKRRVTGVERSIEQLYLTPDDRSALGMAVFPELTTGLNKDVASMRDEIGSLRSRVETIANERPSPADSAVDPSKIEACNDHKWSSIFLDNEPRLKRNTDYADEFSNSVYVRACLRCRFRQVRGNLKENTALKTTHQDAYWWHDD